jgi:hypothetical protein
MDAMICTRTQTRREACSCGACAQGKTPEAKRRVTAKAQAHIDFACALARELDVMPEVEIERKRRFYKGIVQRSFCISPHLGPCATRSGPLPARRSADPAEREPHLGAPVLAFTVYGRFHAIVNSRRQTQIRH